RTEQAPGLTDIGRLEPQIVVVVGPRAVAPLALAVGQPPDGQQIAAFEEADPFVERQPLACLQLLVDSGQTGRLHPCSQLGASRAECTLPGPRSTRDAEPGRRTVRGARLQPGYVRRAGSAPGGPAGPGRGARACYTPLHSPLRMNREVGAKPT